MTINKVENLKALFNEILNDEIEVRIIHLILDEKTIDEIIDELISYKEGGSK